MKLKTTRHAGWNNCLHLSNGTIEAVVTTEVGPRLIHFGFAKQENLLGMVKADRSKRGGKKFRAFGGHRFWIAPEDEWVTYWPDNTPAAWRRLKDGVAVHRPAERGYALEKTLEVRLAGRGTGLRLLHRLKNRSTKAMKLACWGVTIMKPGGLCVLPLPPAAPHGPAKNFLPKAGLALWSYTDLKDSRFHLGSLAVGVSNLPRKKPAAKLGVGSGVGWAAWSGSQGLLVKKFDHHPAAEYPDRGCQAESFTAGDYHELETLGPLRTLGPGQSTTYEERWSLFKPVRAASVDGVYTKIKSKL